MTSATGEAGFTLLELLVVLAIMVLLAGAWPVAADHLFPNQALRNETERLLTSLQSVRTRARITHQPQFLEVAATGDGYTAATDQHDLPRPMSLGLRDRDDKPSVHLIFFPDGSSTGGVLDFGLYAHRREIRVGPLTGRAEVTP